MVTGDAASTDRSQPEYRFDFCGGHVAPSAGFNPQVFPAGLVPDLLYTQSLIPTVLPTALSGDAPDPLDQSIRPDSTARIAAATSSAAAMASRPLFPLWPPARARARA